MPFHVHNGRWWGWPGALRQCWWSFLSGSSIEMVFSVPQLVLRFPTATGYTAVTRLVHHSSLLPPRILPSWEPHRPEFPVSPRLYVPSQLWVFPRFSYFRADMVRIRRMAVVAVCWCRRGAVWTVASKQHSFIDDGWLPSFLFPEQE